MTELTVTTHDTVEELNANQLDNLVEQSDLGSVFQRYGWLRAIERGLDRTPRHVVVYKKDNPVAVFPNYVTPLDGPGSRSLRRLAPAARLVSTDPGYGGPVVTTDESDCLPLLFDELERLKDRSVVFHFIRTNDLAYVRYGQFLARRGYAPVLGNCRFVLDLDDGWEQLLDGMSRSRRRTVRKALESDHEFEELEPTDRAVRETYRRYRGNMERVGGEPVPLEFFDEVVSGLGERSKTFVAEVDGVEVGRYVYLLDDERSTIHHFFPAIGDESNFEHYPSELLHARAIQWGIENDYAHYDFGGTGSSFEQGSFKQKAAFGGRAVPTLQWERGHAPVRWRLYKLARRAYWRASNRDGSEP